MVTENNPFNLKDKLILITGASSGIGRQCAINCSSMGASVVIFGRDRERLEETKQMMILPQDILSYSIDLLDYKNIEEAVKDIVGKKGKISGLINCAGISTTIPLNVISPEKMEHYLQTNVIGPVNLVKQVVKSNHFCDSGGSIIFISSVMGCVGEAGKSLYALTKGALNAATRSLAIELAPKKIRVNAILPGVVETPMSKKSYYSNNEESLNKIKYLHPLGLGRPDDVANACVYLLSDASLWVTGTKLIVDGGYTAK